MDRVTAAIDVENLHDLWAVRDGRGDSDSVRVVGFSAAFVDDGAMMLSLPAAAIAALGLERTRRVRVVGPDTAAVYSPVRLTVAGRSCTAEVLELPDSMVPRVGRLALLALDLVLDAERRKLIGNPAHGGEWVIEAF